METAIEKDEEVELVPTRQTGLDELVPVRKTGAKKLVDFYAGLAKAECTTR